MKLTDCEKLEKKIAFIECVDSWEIVFYADGIQYSVSVNWDYDEED